MIDLVFARHIRDRRHRTLPDAPAALLTGPVERSAGSTRAAPARTASL
ncbi:hypothetical protein [Streptomyces sp. NPDC017448]